LDACQEYFKTVRRALEHEAANADVVEDARVTSTGDEQRLRSDRIGGDNSRLRPGQRIAGRPAVVTLDQFGRSTQIKLIGRSGADKREILTKHLSSPNRR
jgi:hypothetical protein